MGLIADWQANRYQGKLRRAAEDCRGMQPRPGYGRVRYESYYPRHQPYIPFTLGNVTIDLQPKAHETVHVIVCGATRMGKSTAVASLLELPIGVLIIALDNTRPLARMIRSLPDGVEWTNEPGGIGWNMLRGDPRLVAEGLCAGWPKSSTDAEHYRRIARGRLIWALRRADRTMQSRSLPLLVEALMLPSKSVPVEMLDMNLAGETFIRPIKLSDGMIDRANQHWANKLIAMYDALNGSLGHGLDLLEAMEDRKKVLMRLNRYLHHEDAPTLGGMLLVNARRVAQECRLPFILVVEEAGVLGQHEEQIVPLTQAAADRQVPTVLITQNMNKMRDEITNNVGVYVSFAQEAKAEVEKAAWHLKVHNDQLRREAFPIFPGVPEQQGRGWCYVRAPGMATHLVHVEPRVVVSDAPQQPVIEQEPEYGPDIWLPSEQPALGGWERLRLPVHSVSSVPDKDPDWVGTDKYMLRWYANMRRIGLPVPLWGPTGEFEVDASGNHIPIYGVWWDEQGCLEWKGPYSKHRGEKLMGRPRATMGRGPNSSKTVYIETAKAAGRPTDPAWDHDCDNPICCDPRHGHAESNGQNNGNRPVRDKMLKQAWLDRYGQVPQWWLDRKKPRCKNWFELPMERWHADVATELLESVFDDAEVA